MEKELKTAGKALARLDGAAKVTGKMKYGNDINRFGQLYMAVLYAKYPWAEIRGIDLSEAREFPGVADIITAADVPGSNTMFGRFPVLAGDQVRFIGEGVAAAAAETGEAACRAVDLIRVEYGEIFNPILNAADALREGAPLIHRDKGDNYVDAASHKLIFNDVRKGLEESDLVLERSYFSGFVDQGYIEPEALIAEYDEGAGSLLIQGAIQNPYSVRSCAAEALGLPLSRIRVVQSGIGGSFGGKDEGVIINAVRAGLLSMRTGRPVKVSFTREESFLATSKRHPFDMKFKIGLKTGGKIQAVESRFLTPSGPYNKQAMFSNWRASIHAAGPYEIPHVNTRVDGVYTNTIYGGAYRGFSAPQVLFGIESLVDECAEELGMNPAEFRLLNCFRPNSPLPTGQIMDSAKMPANLGELMSAVCEKTDFSAKWRRYREEQKRRDGGLCRGIGLALTFRGAGLGGEGIDAGSAQITVNADGHVQVQTCFTEMGQGISTAVCQIAAEELGLPLDRISWLPNDTAANTDTGPTVASRSCMIGGLAVQNGAGIIKSRMASVLAPLLGCAPGELEFKDGEIRSAGNPEKRVSFDEGAQYCLQKAGLSLSAHGWYSPGPPPSFDHSTGQGPAYPAYVLGAAAAEITVDCVTGKIRTESICAAYALGRAINPQIVRGQFMGGLVQGLGFALMEEMDNPGGYLKTRNFDDFMIPGAMDIPAMEIILFEKAGPLGPYGALGIGEFGVELAAPAIANAHANATGRRIRSLPLSLERVREAGHV
ncbi:MAG: xanthine dehydrogenase family protein molybdopterin-binding subunit [Treponema sp.]|jgi:CO/xanthine dehydrogenase Mo-binding subunit|nr:xanthine dehydrogenase family protein molybdopterin-binding subunit [Treponema sp.]